MNKIDEAITFNVNRGLIHEDRWTDLKDQLYTLIKDEVIGERDEQEYPDELRQQYQTAHNQTIDEMHRKLDALFGKEQ